MPKFSIITPTWNRMSEGRLPRCIRSVQCQTFTDYEHIIVDDGSTDGTEAYVRDLSDRDWRIHYVKIGHSGRVIARNEGMKASMGSWIVWLDSDDALDAEYLNTFNYHIEQEPDVRVWVCGAIYHGMAKDNDGAHLVPRWTKIRSAWIPRQRGELFNSGHVGTGMFVFHKEASVRIGLMPPWKNHNEIADGIDEWLGLKPGATGYSSAKRLVGNPWGDDHCVFQKLCMYYSPVPIDAALYVQYVR